MSYPAPTPAPSAEDIQTALQNRDLLLSVIDGVTSLLDGVLTGLGLTVPTTYTVIGSSTVLPTNLTTSSPSPTSRPDDDDDDSTTSTSTSTTTAPTGLPTSTPASTSEEEDSTTTTSTRSTSTEDSSTTTSTRTRTPDRDPTTTQRTTTVFTTTSSLSLSVSGTQTFTQVVVVTIPAGVPATPVGDRSSSSSNGGTIGGVVGGVVGGLAVLAFLLAALFTWKRRKDRTGHGWFLCFGRRPGKRGAGGAGSDDGWPTFDPSAGTMGSAAASTHRDPFAQDRSAHATLPNLADVSDLENPDMMEYTHGGGSAYGTYGPAAAAAAGGAAGAAYYPRSPTQQSFYPPSSHPSQNSHGGALGMYAPDDTAAQQAYAHNAARAVSPGPGGALSHSQHSHGGESFGNDYSHLDPPDVRAQREREAEAAAAAAAAAAAGATASAYGQSYMPHSRKSSQASAFGLSPFMGTSALAPVAAPTGGPSPAPPSYHEQSGAASNAAAGAGAGAGAAAVPGSPPTHSSRLPAVRDAGEEELDVAAAERAVPGAPGTNRLQLSNPDTTI